MLLRKFDSVAPPEVMLPDYTEVASWASGEDIAVREGVVILTHTTEVAVSLQHCRSIPEISFCHKHQKGQRIGKPSQKKFFPPLFPREVLMEQQQVIAEIQICLLRVALTQ